MKKKILNYIVKLLEEKNKIDKKYKSKIKDYQYLNSGHIDSLQLIHFILRLEKKYKIKLETEEKESSKFKTIGGLTDKIYTKIT